MPEQAELDEAFAQHLSKLGMATYDQVEEARKLQSGAEKRGQRLSLADALVLSDVITESIKDNVLKQIESRKTGGHKTLGQYKLLKKLGENRKKMFLAFLEDPALHDVSIQRKHLAAKDHYKFFTLWARPNNDRAYRRNHYLAPCPAMRTFNLNKRQHFPKPFPNPHMHL